MNFLLYIYNYYHAHHRKTMDDNPSYIRPTARYRSPLKRRVRRASHTSFNFFADVRFLDDVFRR